MRVRKCNEYVWLIGMYGLASFKGLFYFDLIQMLMHVNAMFVQFQGELNRHACYLSAGCNF